MALVVVGAATGQFEILNAPVTAPPSDCFAEVDGQFFRQFEFKKFFPTPSASSKFG